MSDCNDKDTELSTADGSVDDRHSGELKLHQSTIWDCFWLADSYKVSHHKQYPPGTTQVYSYFESRGGMFSEVCFFGLQYILKRWMVGPVVRIDNLYEASEFYSDHFGTPEIFNEAGFKYIYENHNGYLPLRIKAVPEGMIVPVRNVLFTVENTDPNLPWLTNWFETVLLQCWYPMTVATLSRGYKETIAKYLYETADSLESLRFKLHDFGYRGASSVESAAIGDAAHLVNFVGTDTIAGLRLCRKYYNCAMAGYSIPAAEHSTITAWGEEREAEAFRVLLEQFPTGLVSVVSDSYDLYRACDEIWGVQLKDLVDERGKNGGVLVIRPDSGEPKEVVVKVLEILSKHYGSTVNTKGYKQLPPHVRLIQGDGINYNSTGEILEAMKKAGWSAENVAFGTGGALLQKINRDTQKCAFKCSNITVNGTEQIVFKDPVTDPSKRSKKGRLTLECRNGKIVTIDEGKGDPAKDLLQTVFENGKLLIDLSLDEIRERAEIDLVRRWRQETGQTNGTAH